MKVRYIRNARDFRDAVLLIILGIAAVIVLCNTIPLKSKIEKTYTGILWEFYNLDDYTETEIRISGEYTRYLFHLFHDRDKFEGSIVISALDYTKDYLMMPINISNKPYELNNILYLDAATGDCEIMSIAAAPMLTEGVFLLGRNSSDDRQIAVSYPGTDREQAVLCAQKLLNKDFNIY